jgi:hypothetical protein
MTQINKGDLIRVTYQDGDRTLWVEGVADRFNGVAWVTAQGWLLTGISKGGRVEVLERGEPPVGTIVTARPRGGGEWVQYIRTEKWGWYPVTYYTYPQNWTDLEVKDDD